MNKIKMILNKIKCKHYILVGLIILELLILLVISKFSVKPLERRALNLYGDNVMSYISLIKKDKPEYYIYYVLTYYDEEYNKDKVKVKDITEFINTHFDKKISEEDIRLLNNNEILFNNHISYDSINDQYIKNHDLDKELKRDNQIIKYEIYKIRKQNKNTFIVTYNKYVVDNINILLNYYIENNKQEIVDSINNSLKNNYSSKNILKYVNKDMKKIVKNKGQIKIKYVIEDNNIFIKLN